MGENKILQIFLILFLVFNQFKISAYCAKWEWRKIRKIRKDLQDVGVVGLLSNDITCVYTTNDMAFIGTADKGICIYGFSRQSPIRGYKNIRQNDKQLISESLISDTILCITFSPVTKKIYAGTPDGLSIISINDFSIKNITAKEGLPSNHIKSIGFFGNKVYVGTDKGLAILSGDSPLRTLRKEEIYCELINNISTSGDRKYISTSAGLVILKGSSSEFMNSSNGLPLDWITCTCPITYQDDEFLAIGTAGGGLVITDENFRELKIYNTENTNYALTSNWITSLAYNKNLEILFICTNQGLTIFNFKNKSFRKITPSAAGLLSNNVRQVSISEDGGNIFIATDKGLNRIVLKKSQKVYQKCTSFFFTRYFPHEKFARKWDIIFPKFLFYRFDITDDKKLYTLVPSAESKIFRVDLFVKSPDPHEKNLYLYYPPYNTKALEFTGTVIRDICVSPDNFGYIATNDGIYKFEIINTYNLGSYQQFTRKHGLASDDVKAIYFDKNENCIVAACNYKNGTAISIGTDFKFKSIGVFDNLTRTTENKVIKSEANSIIRYRHLYFVGTKDKGLAIFNGKITQYFDKLPFNDRVFSLFLDGETLYVVMTEKLILLNANTLKIINIITNERIGATILYACPDTTSPKNCILLGTNLGVTRYYPDEDKVEKFLLPHIPRKNYNAMGAFYIKIKFGMIFIATLHGILCYLNK